MNKKYEVFFDWLLQIIDHDNIIKYQNIPIDWDELKESNDY
jgi:hypothetical protein